MTDFYNGIIDCDTINSVYHVTHPIINILNSFPVVSLVAPTTAGSLFIESIANRITTGFDVVLSAVPPTSGFHINWQVNIPGTGPNEFINDKRYYSKEEIGHPKLSRVHWKNVISAPDLSPQGLQNNHNHDNRYFTKAEIVPIIEAEIENTGAYTPIANSLMLRNPQGRSQVNTPKVSVDAANKGYVDNKVNIEAGIRNATDVGLQTQITSISGDYTPISETAQLQIQVSMLESLVKNITGGSLFGGGNVPVGTIISLATSASPGVDWLFLDGTSYAVSAYSDLFAVIGYTFGGAGANFNVPESRGEFFRGWDAGRGVDAGRAFGSWQDSNNKSHTHNTVLVAAADHSHTISPQPPDTTSIMVVTGGGNLVNFNVPGASSTQPAGAHTHTANVSASGITESRPRNYAVSYFIKAFNPPIATPVDLTSTQSISGQKSFVLPVILPNIPQALIFGDPTATGTYAIGVIGGNLSVTIHTSAGPWALVNIIS